MTFGAGAYALGFLAGLLSILSPCVLPLLPLVLATSAGAHRRGPLALAAGLALSFAIVGTAIAWAAGQLGFDAGVLRVVGAVMLVVLGLVLLSSGLQMRFASATSGVANAGHTLLARLSPEGLGGQFVIGLVLGVVWSPCVGPTLGSAVALASQGEDLASIALLMLVFGLGAGLPLLALGLLSRSAMARMRGALMATGKAGKTLLGLALVAIGLLIASGTDKRVEAWAVDHSPAWLTELTTRY